MMKLTKRLLTLALPLLFLFGCSSSENSSEHVSCLDQWMKEEVKPRVLSTTGMIGNLVEIIGGDAIVHVTLIEGELDPHSYELVKGDAEKLSCAHLVFYNGLGLEHGASLKHWLTCHKRAIALGDRLDAKELICVDHQVDPHIWMDLRLSAKLIDFIVEELSNYAPEHAELFALNGEQLRSELLGEHQKMIDALHQIPPERRFLVSSHDAFNYFVRAYFAESGDWEARICAPEGLAPEGQIGSGDLQKVIDYLIAKNVSVVFPESNVSQHALEKIAAVCSKLDHTLNIANKPLYGDAMGRFSYIEMMKHNKDVLIKNLRHE